MPQQTKIVIVGAGFAGLACALELEKKSKGDRNFSITLIDKRDYFLFTPSLYEAAASDEELTGISQLKKSVAVPFKETLKGKNINFIKSELTSVQNVQNKITVGQRTVEYDYLVLALGGVPDFLKIEGADKYSLPFCSLPDALRIRNALEFAVQARCHERDKKTVRIAIVGSYPCSIELAGELKGLLDFIAWKNGYPREKLEIVLLESSGRLLPGFSEQAAKQAFYRLKELGVRVNFGNMVSSVDRHFLEFVSTERMEYDVLIWNAGHKAPFVKFEEEVLKDKKGRLQVNQNLQVNGSSRIFAIGDLAAVVDQTGKESAGSGVGQAMAQAGYLARIFPLLLRNQKPQAYKYVSQKHIINIGGKWALAISRNHWQIGYWPYVLGQLANFRLYWILMGLKRAWKNWWLQKELYGRND